MNALYNAVLKQTQVLQRDLGEFDANVSTAPLLLQGLITLTLLELQRTVDEYGKLVKSEVGEDKRAKGEARLLRFQQELQEARGEFGRLKAKRDTELAEANRLELFGRRGADAGDNPYALLLTLTPFLYQHNQDQVELGGSGMLHYDGMLRENATLLLGNEQLDRMIAQASELLDQLVEQNETLQRMQATMHLTLTTLGVSSQTIRFIERKAWQDKWIFYIGALVTLVVFYYTIKWLR